MATRGPDTRLRQNAPGSEARALKCALWFDVEKRTLANIRPSLVTLRKADLKNGLVLTSR